MCHWTHGHRHTMRSSYRSLWRAFLARSCRSAFASSLLLLTHKWQDVFMSVANFTDFNIENLGVKKQGRNRKCSDESSCDQPPPSHVLQQAPPLKVSSEAPVQMNLKQQCVFPHIQTTAATNAGRLLETPVSAGLGAEKLIHCSSSSSSCCFRPSPPTPWHCSGFYYFFCGSGLKNSPDFFTLAAAAATHQYGDEDGPRQHWHGDDKNLKVHCTEKESRG